MRVTVSDTIIRGQHCGQVWAQAIERLLEQPAHKLLHLIVEITEPGAEDQAVRNAVDALLATRNLDPVTTVVNTLFPAALAASSSDPQQLASRYRAMYPRIRVERRVNHRGTYFGRLVAHPTDGKPTDQLNRIITRLRGYGHNSNHAATVYEASLSVATLDPVEGSETTQVPAEIMERSDGTAGLSAPTFAPRSDSMPLGFPCLVHISFQHCGDQVHALAHYRSQYMIQRGYGNYLALGLLLRYIAESAGLRPGTLTVVTGQAEAEGAQGDIRQTLADITQLPLFSAASRTTAPPQRRRQVRTLRPDEGAALELPLQPDQP